MVGEISCWLWSEHKTEVNSDYLYSQNLYLCLPVSGSYTLLTCACCFSYSSFVIGTMDLLKGIRDTTISDQCIHSVEVPALLFAVSHLAINKLPTIKFYQKLNDTCTINFKGNNRKWQVFIFERTSCPLSPPTPHLFLDVYKCLLCSLYIHLTHSWLTRTSFLEQTQRHQKLAFVIFLLSHCVGNQKRIVNKISAV